MENVPEKHVVCTELSQWLGGACADLAQAGSDKVSATGRCRMNRREVFAAVVPPAAGFAALAGTALTPRRLTADEPARGRLDDLLKERLAVLAEIAKQTAAEYRIGKVTIDRVHHAQMAVLSARLESAKSGKERLPILEEALALAKESEKTATQLYETGRAPASDPLVAKAARLEVEIALEREKAKDGHPR